MLLRDLTDEGSGALIQIDTRKFPPGSILNIRIMSRRNYRSGRFRVGIEAHPDIRIMPIYDDEVRPKEE